MKGGITKLCQFLIKDECLECLHWLHSCVNCVMVKLSSKRFVLFFRSRLLWGAICSTFAYVVRLKFAFLHLLFLLLILVFLHLLVFHWVFAVIWRRCGGGEWWTQCRSEEIRHSCQIYPLLYSRKWWFEVGQRCGKGKGSSALIRLEHCPLIYSFMRCFSSVMDFSVLKNRFFVTPNL